MRIAAYGDVDLNLIDGSAIWLASLVETLAQGPDRVTLFLKAVPRRELLLGPLRRLRNVEQVEVASGPTAASPSQALDAIEREDAREPFAVVVLRGFRLSGEAALRPRLAGRLWVYLTDIPQSREALDEAAREALTRIGDAAGLILCQTEALRKFLEAELPAARGKTALLPPMIPPAAPPAERRAGEPRRMVYAGKFAPLWGTLEMVDVFRAVRSRYRAFELHVYGDKIHRPPDQPGYRPAMEAALRDTPGVVWHGAVPRDRVLADLPSMDVAWAWRLPALSASLELSTKLLEYGAAGVPSLLNRSPMHEELLGPDYPLFADSVDEVTGTLLRLWDEPAILRRAAEAVWRRTADHQFPAVYATHLEPRLAPSRALDYAG